MSAYILLRQNSDSVVQAAMLASAMWCDMAVIIVELVVFRLSLDLAVT